MYFSSIEFFAVCFNQELLTRAKIFRITDLVVAHNTPASINVFKVCGTTSKDDFPPKKFIGD